MSHFTFLQGSMSCLSLSVQPPVECSMAPQPFQTLKSKQNIKIVKKTQNKTVSLRQQCKGYSLTWLWFNVWFVQIKCWGWMQLWSLYVGLLQKCLKMQKTNKTGQLIHIFPAKNYSRLFFIQKETEPDGHINVFLWSKAQVNWNYSGFGL